MTGQLRHLNQSSPLFLRHLMAGIRHHDAQRRLTEGLSPTPLSYPGSTGKCPDTTVLRYES